MLNLVIIITTVFTLTFACSPPEGWYPLTPKQRLSRARVVVHGQVDDIVNYKQGYTMKFSVQCVTRNLDKVTIGKKLIIQDPWAKLK